MSTPRMDAVQYFRISDEEDDEIYEKIEAPKFVDLRAPDNYHPGDDCRWFCSRVGCDRKHEEEIDPETIYQNFVLRVMAARSPNVKFQRTTYRKNQSEVCPHTVPGKSLKPRVSRIALISSIPTNNGDPKQRPALAKSLAVPSKNKHVSFADTPTNTQLPRASRLSKIKATARSLVFDSGKKLAAEDKKRLQIFTPVSGLCAAERKKEATGSQTPSPSSGKKFRGREVKSRVFDVFSKSSGNGGCRNGTPPKCAGQNLKKKKKKTVFEDLLDGDGSNSSSSCSEENGDQRSAFSRRDDTGYHEKENASPCSNRMPRIVENGTRVHEVGLTKNFQALKDKTLKPTSPKPFRLRTNERCILKEAKMEKKSNHYVVRDENFAPKLTRSISERKTKPIPDVLSGCRNGPFLQKARSLRS